MRAFVPSIHSFDYPVYNGLYQINSETMSSITIATLPRMSREALSSLLLSAGTANTIAIVDVRDTGTFQRPIPSPYIPRYPSSFRFEVRLTRNADHVGGHISGSTWVPSSSLDYRMPELVRTLQDKEKVVFHCALSQRRGPSAALRYARERAGALGDNANPEQQVYVLDGGFVRWQEKFGRDERLTQAYAEDIWRDY